MTTTTKSMTISDIKALNTRQGFYFFEKGKKQFHHVVRQIAYRNHVIEEINGFESSTIVKVWKLNLDESSDRYGSLTKLVEFCTVQDAKDWVKNNP